MEVRIDATWEAMRKALTIGRQVDAGIHCKEVIKLAFAAVLGRELSD